MRDASTHCEVSPVSDGTVFTCKNHPRLRWFNTKPGGSLVFDGEVMADGRLKPAQPIGPLPPVKHLRARLNNVNPYDSRIEEDGRINDWDDLLSFVEYINHTLKKWALECECPGSDLVKVENETLETRPRHEWTPPEKHLEVVPDESDFVPWTDADRAADFGDLLGRPDDQA